MNDVVALEFDLTPPSQDELRGLVADLSEDERHVMLEPRHRSTLLRRFPRRETGGRLHLPSVRTASIQGRRKERNMTNRSHTTSCCHLVVNSHP